MKLISFNVDGRESYGAVIGDGVVDLGKRLGDGNATLRQAIATMGMEKLVELAGAAERDLALADIVLRKPIPDTGKTICVGLNYRPHAAEAKLDLPKTPLLFMRIDNSIVAHDEPVVRPRVSDNYDWEGELAVVIGRKGRHVSREQAMDYVAGYTLFMDGSLRDYQFQHCLFVGKNFYHSASVGPWIVPAAAIADPHKLRLQTRLNGQAMQDTVTDALVFDIPDLIAYISTFTELEPGDVIATGTPEGVGFVRKPPVFLKPGDRIEVEIDGIGLLGNNIAEEASA